MLKLGKQILHTLVLLITGMALIGVNVTQSGCIHSDRTYLEVRVLPAENTSPWVERVLQMQLSVFTLPECAWEMTMQILAVRDGKDGFAFYRKFPGIPPSLESLCTFLC